MVKNESCGVEILGRSVVAGVAGTVVMTVFQKLVEMPLTGRPDSYAPAELVEKVFRVHPEGPARRRINNATHLALGSMWGAACGPRRAPRPGCRGGGVRGRLHGGRRTQYGARDLSDAIDRGNGPARTGQWTSSTSWSSQRHQPIDTHLQMIG